MGLNTAVMVRNDFLTQIENDSAFGTKLVMAINSVGHPTAPYWGQGFDVLSSCQSDINQVVVVGNNMIKRIGYTNSHDEVEFLKELARTMGYRLVRLPEK